MINRRVAITTLLATPFASAAQENQDQRRAEEQRIHNDWPNLERYRDANRRVAQGTVDVVFMGDSITEGWREPTAALTDLDIRSTSVAIDGLYLVVGAPPQVVRVAAVNHVEPVASPEKLNAMLGKPFTGNGNSATLLASANATPSSTCCTMRLPLCRV